MDYEYELEVESTITLPGAPVALESISFSTPQPLIAAVVRDTHSVVLIAPGDSVPTTTIEVGEDPCDITGGGGDIAYVACRGSQCIDIIDRISRVGRIQLPGIPHGIAWNGSFKPASRRIMVTCQLPQSEEGIVCVIDEASRSICNVLSVGKQPRGISLAHRNRLLLVANFGGDSVAIIDQPGTKVLHTLATAGKPWAANDSWSDPEHIIISLQAGGVLQRMDALRYPPALSGLTSLRRNPGSDDSLTPYCCVPMGQDDLWLVPDKYSETIALVRSRGREFRQINSYAVGSSEPASSGLGQVAIAVPGLPASIYVANLRRNQILRARVVRHNAA